MSSQPDNRRGFLRGLVSLPLIGGGVTLIGNPTAAAEPVSRALLAEYINWLAFERQRAGTKFCEAPIRGSWEYHGPAYAWHSMDIMGGGQPSDRAAVVLAAVGCEWRGA